MPFHPTRCPEAITEECIESTENECYSRGEHHKDIHARRAMAQLTEGRDVETATADDYTSQRNDERQLIGCIATADVDPSHGYRHHQEGKYPRQDYAATQQKKLACHNLLCGTRVVDYEVVANGIYLFLHLLRRYHRRVEIDCRRTTDKIHIGRRDTCKRTEFSLNICRACRACHADDRNSFLHSCLLFFFPAYESGICLMCGKHEHLGNLYM